MSLADIHRREYGRILASLIRVVRDISLAEDALQDAFAAALEQWPVRGTPKNPAAWLMTTARNRAIDQIRRSAMAEGKAADIVEALPPNDLAPNSVDTLRLIFTCCHPALARDAQVALTLRTICGLSTEEISRAFLVPVATMAQRLVRAKNKIRLAKIPYEVPDNDELPERLETVLAVVYLVFNEGYSASFGGDHIRADLCNEAIRLARQIIELLPDEPEAKALLALMILHHSRRDARLDAAGDIVLLDEQDRSKWHRDEIDEGVRLLPTAFSGGDAGYYALQAAIAATHAAADTFESTNWRQIAELYSALGHLVASPILELNRAVAVALSEGPEVGLKLIEKIELPTYHLWHAAKADMLRRLHRNREAADAYREALTFTSNEAERRFLQRRLSELI